ncbi:hypothetical protein OAM69_06835 [bacterium]|nr:hypothetical protein [bacterium]
MKKYKKTLYMVTATALLVALMIALGITPEGIGIAGHYLLAVRVVLYVCVFVFFFESITAPFLTNITQNPNYVDLHARPHRYRCLFWLLFAELCILVPWF